MEGCGIKVRLTIMAAKTRGSAACILTAPLKPRLFTNKSSSKQGCCRAG